MSACVRTLRSWLEQIPCRHGLAQHRLRYHPRSGGREIRRRLAIGSHSPGGVGFGFGAERFGHAWPLPAVARVSSAVTEREAWSRGCARSTRPCTTRSNSAPMSLCTGRVGANYRKTAASDSAGKERPRPACGARSRPTSSGQRHRPPCNVAAPAGLPGERRKLRLRPRSCRQSSRAKTSPRSAPQVAARRRHRHRPQASATGQATTRPSAATSPAPSSSPATGQAGAAPSSAAVVAVANRVARAVGPLHTTC